jgi:hypothetical protein
MQKLKDLENYIALQIYYFKNAVVETKEDTKRELKELYRNAVDESILLFSFSSSRCDIFKMIYN